MIVFSLESEWEQASSGLQIIITFYHSFGSFSHEHQLMVFHSSLNDTKFAQVFRTLLSILADLNNAVV